MDWNKTSFTPRVPLGGNHRRNRNIQERGILVRKLLLIGSYMEHGVDATVQSWCDIHGQACYAAMAACNAAGICYPNNNQLPTSCKSNAANRFP